MKLSGFQQRSISLGITSDTAASHYTVVFCPKDNHFSFHSSFVVSHCRNHGKTNVRFNRPILSNNDHKVSFWTKSMTIYNSFLCPISFVFEIGQKNPQFSTRWHCRWFYLVAHRYLIFRHHFYENSSSRSEDKKVPRDFNEHAVYFLVISTSYSENE